MDTTDGTTGDPYNAAIAAQLRSGKAEIGRTMTFEALSDMTGIKVRQLKYLLNDQRAIHMRDYMAILKALDIDPADAIREAQVRVEKMLSKQTP